MSLNRCKYELCVIFLRYLEVIMNRFGSDLSDVIN